MIQNASIVVVMASLGMAMTTTPAFSADGQGRYKVIGYGSYHCDDYVASYGNHRVDDSGFGDWLAGYLTGVNFIEGETYDIKGTLDLNGVRDWLATYCGQHADDSVAKAARAFVRAAASSRQQSR